MKIMYHYVYVIKSLRDNDLYIGRTENLKKRFIAHKRGQVPSTKDRRPFKFVYAEICNNIKDAVHREKYLKTARGKRYIKHRVKNDKSS